MDKTNIYCDIKSDDPGASCFECKEHFITAFMCELKCKLRNHHAETDKMGYICKDYKPMHKQVITENVEGGIVDDRA